MVKAMIAAADTICHALKENDHIIFLSGHCFPIKPINELESYLTRTAWKQHILAFDSELANKFSQKRWRHKYWFDLNLFPKSNFRIRRFARKLMSLLTYLHKVKSPKNIRTAIGSQWICLTKECYVDIRKQVLGKELCYLRNSFAPDEMAFHTAVYNSAWRNDTQYRGLQRNYSERISKFSNLHLLDEALSGDFASLCIDEVKDNQFFTRKISSSNFDLFKTTIGSQFKEEYFNDKSN